MNPSRLFNTTARNQIILAGCDTLTLRIVEDLGRADESVTVIVDDVTNRFAVAMKSLGAHIVVGSARDKETLRKAGIERANAVALLAPDDVDNIHAALSIQRLVSRSPHRDTPVPIRLVLRVFNDRLGKRLHSLFEECVILSPGEIAAPAFVGLALEGTHSTAPPITLGDRILSAGPVEHMRQAMLTLSIRTPGGTQILPDEHTSEPVLKRRVLSVTRDEEGMPITALPAREYRTQAMKRSRRPRPFHSLWNSLRLIGTAMTTPRARLTLLWFALLCAVATVVFKLGMSVGWIDAFYRTISVIATAGYDDLLEADTAGWLKLFGAGVLASGVLLMAVITAIIVDDLIDERVAVRVGTSVGVRKNHAVVCGLGAVGMRVAAGLVAAGLDVVGVERNADPALLMTAKSLGIAVVSGDAGDEEILEAAGTARARCIIAVTDNEVTNLQAGLEAQELSENTSIILRLYDDEFARRVEERLGLGISRSVSQLTAPMFTAALLGREVAGTIAVGRRVLLVASTRIFPESDAVGGEPISAERTGEIRILAHTRDEITIWRDELILEPESITFSPGDTITVVATREGLARLLRRTRPAPSAKQAKVSLRES